MVRPLTQVGVDLEPPVRHDLARIEKAMRIKRVLDLAHHPQQPFPELLRHEFAPRNADAVFAGQRAFELRDQRGHLIRKLAKLVQVLG